MAHIASASETPGSAAGRNPESFSKWRRKPWRGAAAGLRKGAQSEGQGRRQRRRWWQQPALPRGAFPAGWGGLGGREGRAAGKGGGSCVRASAASLSASLWGAAPAPPAAPDRPAESPRSPPTLPWLGQFRPRPVAGQELSRGARGRARLPGLGQPMTSDGGGARAAAAAALPSVTPTPAIWRQ